MDGPGNNTTHTRAASQLRQPARGRRWAGGASWLVGGTYLVLADVDGVLPEHVALALLHRQPAARLKVLQHQPASTDQPRQPSPVFVSRG